MPEPVPFPSRWNPDEYPLRRELRLVPPDTLLELLRDAILAGVDADDLPRLSSLVHGIRFVRPVGPSAGAASAEAARRREQAEVAGALIVFVVVLVVSVLTIPNLSLGMGVAVAAMVSFVPLALWRWRRGSEYRGMPGMGCLRCGYDLTAAHKVAMVIELSGNQLELCRCSECGLLWPSHITIQGGTTVPVTNRDETPIDAADVREAILEVRMAIAAAERAGAIGPRS